MTVKADLIEARRLIEDPARWTQGAMARNRIGGSCEPTASYCQSWCAVGAVAYSVGSCAAFVVAPVLDCLNRAAGELFGSESVIDVNDSAGKYAHERVLQVFDLAIADQP